MNQGKKSNYPEFSVEKNRSCINEGWLNVLMEKFFNSATYGSTDFSINCTVHSSLAVLKHSHIK